MGTPGTGSGGGKRGRTGVRPGHAHAAWALGAGGPGAAAHGSARAGSSRCAVCRGAGAIAGLYMRGGMCCIEGFREEQGG